MGKTVILMSICTVVAILAMICLYTRATDEISRRITFAARIQDREARITAHVKEALAAREAFEPLRLIERVRQIQEQPTREIYQDDKSHTNARKTIPELVTRLKSKPKKSKTLKEGKKRKPDYRKPK